MIEPNVHLNHFVGKDSCGGDAGGPAMTRKSYRDPWYQVGIVSFGLSPCGGGAGLYTKVEYFLDWIATHLEP